MGKLINEMEIPAKDKFTKINRHVFNAINTNHEEVMLSASDILKESGLIDSRYNRSIVQSIADIYNNKPSKISDEEVRLAIRSSCLQAHEYDDINGIEDKIKFILGYATSISEPVKPKVVQEKVKGVDYVAPINVNEYEQIKKLGYDISVSLNLTSMSRFVNKLSLVKNADSKKPVFSVGYIRDATKDEMMDIIKKGEYKEKRAIKRVMNDLLNHALKLEGYNVKQEEPTVNKVKPDAGNTIKAPKLKM